MPLLPQVFPTDEQGRQRIVVEGGSLGGGEGGSIDLTETNSRVGPTNEAAAASDTATSGLNGLVKRLLQRVTTVIDRLPTLGAKPVTGSIAVAPTLPSATTVTITSLQTAAIGANFVTFSSVECSSLEIFNNTGTAIEYRRGGTGTTFPILSGTSRIIIGLSNANQISLRRVDQSNTQVTVNVEVFN